MGMPAPVVLPELKWVASPNFNARQPGKVKMVVLHDTEGSYAGAISWFQNPKSQVSAHVVLREDGAEATQMVGYQENAWHCEAFNSESIGLEMAGIASKGFRSQELKVAARIVAFFLHKYKLPPTLLHEADANSGKSGWTCHQLLGVSGGGHHDPGFSTLKLIWFAHLVRKEYNRGNFRTTWGRE
jgi:hypothetical protein